MTVLLIIHTIIVLLLVAVILMQRSSQDGFTGGGGMGNMDSFMSGRASANFLTRTTAVLATIFMVNSLILAYLAAHTDRDDSVVNALSTELEASDAPQPITAPVVPDAE